MYSINTIYIHIHDMVFFYLFLRGELPVTSYPTALALCHKGFVIPPPETGRYPVPGGFRPVFGKSMISNEHK